MSLHLEPTPQLDKFGPIWRRWLYQLYTRVQPGPFKIKAYAKADLPTASDWSDNSDFSAIVYVTDDVGGAVLAFSDGTNWRRVTDRAIIS